MNNHQYYLMIQQFTLFSDFFMHAVFSHSRESVQLLARILTGKTDLIVVEWGLEVKKGFPFFRNDRYDLFIIDQYGNVYNIEIENTLRFLGKRAFHNMCLLGSQGLKPGEEHKALRENWVVFLTKKDFLKQNEPFYSYEWFNCKWRRILNTKAHIRFVNGEYRGDDELGKLMHDFHCTNPDDMFYDELREAKKRSEIIRPHRVSVCAKAYEKSRQSGLFGKVFFFDDVDRHVVSGPQFERSRPLIQQHVHAVGRLASGRFRVFEQFGFLRVVNDVEDEQILVEHRRVGDNGAVDVWRHADIRAVDENVALGNRISQNGLVAKIVQRDVAIGALVERIDDFFGTFEEAVSNIEDVDLLESVQGGLNKDGSGGATRA